MTESTQRRATQRYLEQAVQAETGGTAQLRMNSKRVAQTIASMSKLDTEALAPEVARLVAQASTPEKES